MSLVALEPRQTDMELSMFATLSAIKGKQFGRDVYSSVLKFKDLDKFLSVFPDVQREVNQRKVSALKKYILSGLESENINMRFFSAVTVTCRGVIFYDEINNRMAINTNECKLSINDGQHRFEAINKTLEQLEKDFIKSKNRGKTQRIKKQIDTLKDMVIPVVIFDGLSEKEEKQLFHDLNNLAQRPSRNTNIRLNQIDLFSRISRELAEENKYLRYYGVEMDKMSVQKGNKNTFTLSAIYEASKEILGHRHNSEVLTEENYATCKQYLSDIFDKLFFALPPDLNEKGKYLFDKSYTLKAVSRFIGDCLDLDLSDDEIIETVQRIDWTLNIEFWSKYGASPGKNGNIVFPGGGYGANKAVYEALVDNVKKKD